MEAVDAVVKSFYQKAIHDLMIGFHFRHIKDFDEHIPRIISFWKAQLYAEKSPYAPFDLFGVHRPLKINSAQVRRWVFLFKETLESELSDQGLKKLWIGKLELFQDRFLKQKDLFRG